MVRLDVIKMVFLISWVVSEQPIGPLKEGLIFTYEADLMTK